MADSGDGRSNGRNHRKKLARRAAAGVGCGRGAIGSGGDLLARRQALAHIGSEYLESCQRELDRRATLLGARGCWAFLAEQQRQAERLGVGSELRERVVRAAARFASV